MHVRLVPTWAFIRGIYACADQDQDFVGPDLGPRIQAVTPPFTQTHHGLDRFGYRRLFIILFYLESTV